MGINISETIMDTIQEFEEMLHSKIKVLNETTWESKVKKTRIDKWLENFGDEKEKYHALFLLSNFMFFGNIQIRQLLISLYRDLFKYPIVESIRHNDNNLLDTKIIKERFYAERKNTRFLGLGNSSESGTHLLYYFRQENNLPKDLFISNEEIFIIDDTGNKVLRDNSVTHYVLFDDFCGSGSQAIDYSEDIVKDIKALNANITVSYLALFSTKSGKQTVVDNTSFDIVEAVVEFDESFKFFDENSRYLQDCSSHIERDYLEEMCARYGEPLVRDLWIRAGYTDFELDDQVLDSKLGFGNCQLLIGFSHNIPDNTLPIIWYDEQSIVWYPIFKRYNKNYGS